MIIGVCVRMFDMVRYGGLKEQHSPGVNFSRSIWSLNLGRSVLWTPHSVGGHQHNRAIHSTRHGNIHEHGPISSHPRHYMAIHFGCSQLGVVRNCGSSQAISPNWQPPQQGHPCNIKSQEKETHPVIMSTPD